MNAILSEEYEARVLSNDAIEVHLDYLRLGFEQMQAALPVLRDKIDQLSEKMDSKFEAQDKKFTEKFEALESSLSARIEEVNTSLGARIEEVNNSLGTRIDAVNTSLGARIEAVNNSHTLSDGSASDLRVRPWQPLARILISQFL